MRYSPESGAVRKPVQRAPTAFLPDNSGGRLFSLRSTLGSTRVATGAGLGPGPNCLPSQLLYSAFNPGFPSCVLNTLYGTGLPSLRRNCVPGTKVILAFGNSAFSPSIIDTVCVGMPA